VKPAALLLVLAALVAGCGGGGTTTVIEKTVTVDSPGGGETGGGATTGDTGGDATTGGETEVPGGETEASDDEAEAPGKEDKVEEPTRVVHLQSFRSPSGNIGCVMFDGGARCDIRKRDWSPPSRSASCPEQVDFGQGLTVDHAGRASIVCAGDTALDPSATALDYGEVSELGGTQCISRSEGITCANHSGHGFFIATQSYKFF
jgi:hypothetical protein